MAVNCQVGAGKWTLVHHKSSQYSQLSHQPHPHPSEFNFTLSKSSWTLCSTCLSQWPFASPSQRSRFNYSIERNSSSFELTVIFVCFLPSIWDALNDQSNESQLCVWKDRFVLLKIFTVFSSFLSTQIPLPMQTFSRLFVLSVDRTVPASGMSRKLWSMNPDWRRQGLWAYLPALRQSHQQSDQRKLSGISTA